MFISPAFAQNGGGGGDTLISLLPLVLIFVVFYFLLIRPQQKKVKQHRAMVEAVRRGDRVVTNGGLIGTVTKVISDNELQVQIADGVRVRVMRHMIQEVLAKTEPSAGAESAAKKKGANGQDTAAAPAANEDRAPAAQKSERSLFKLFGSGTKPQ